MSWRDKRKTGIVVMVIGVISVGIGILFNYFIPRSLQKTIVEEMCVSSVDHPAYEQWVRGMKKMKVEKFMKNTN